MPNLVDAIGAVLHDGGDGEILLVLRGGRLRAVQHRSGSRSAKLTSEPVDERNLVDALAKVLQEGGYGSVEAELQKGRLHETAYRVTVRPQRRTRPAAGPAPPGQVQHPSK